MARTKGDATPPTGRSSAGIGGTSKTPEPPPVSLLSDDDLYLFNEGSHLRLWEHLGAHEVTTPDGTSGVYFAVWAPSARTVSVIGDFNGWDVAATLLAPRASSGIWEGFVPGLERGVLYKFHIVSRERRYAVDKADPLALSCEIPPKTASVVWDTEYEWGDGEWMSKAQEQQCPRRADQCVRGAPRVVAEGGRRGVAVAVVPGDGGAASGLRE